MIYGKKDIKEYFQTVGKKYFAIYKKGTVSAGNSIFKMDEDVESTPDDAYRKFEEILGYLHTGEYTLMLHDSAKVSTRGNNTVDFRISMDDSLTNQTKDVVAGIGGISGPVDYDTMMTKAKAMAVEEFQKLKAQDDLVKLQSDHAQLQKDLKEANAKVDDPWNKFIGALAPHADGIIGSLIAKPAAPQLAHAVSGFVPDVHLDENATEEEINANAQRIFENFAAALQEAKPTEWLEILVKLTTLIKNNPKKFDTALTFL